MDKNLKKKKRKSPEIILLAYFLMKRKKIDCNRSKKDDVWMGWACS